MPRDFTELKDSILNTELGGSKIVGRKNAKPIVRRAVRARGVTLTGSEMHRLVRRLSLSIGKITWQDEDVDWRRLAYGKKN